MLRIVVFAILLNMGLSTRAEPQFPRLMGMNIGAKNYDLPSYQQDLARLDLVVLGFYPGWNNANRDLRAVLQALKRTKPDLLIGQYSILNEADDNPKNVATQDLKFKLNRENWWLRRADGSKVQWTSAYGTWDINFTEWSKPDFNGNRYPEWLAERDFRVFFKNASELDIWYFDNVIAYPRIERADWNLDGMDENGKDLQIQRAVRRGMAVHWEYAKSLAPSILLMGNTDSDLSLPEFAGRLHGAFLEGLMGHTWSIEHSAGWGKMMDRYHNVFANLIAPKLVGFNVAGRVDNYRFFRYAFTSCLLDNGHFSYTDEKVGYSSVPWFDEYDAKLGLAIDPPQLAAWQSHVYRRRFEKGMVLVNPTDSAKRLVVEAGYRRLPGKQAPDVNNGLAVTELIIPAKDGMVLIKDR